MINNAYTLQAHKLRLMIREFQFLRDNTSAFLDTSMLLEKMLFCQIAKIFRFNEITFFLTKYRCAKRENFVPKFSTFRQTAIEIFEELSLNIRYEKSMLDFVCLIQD